jgi:hypothetical protein
MRFESQQSKEKALLHPCLMVVSTLAKFCSQANVGVHFPGTMGGLAAEDKKSGKGDNSAGGIVSVDKIPDSSVAINSVEHAAMMEEIVTLLLAFYSILFDILSVRDRWSVIQVLLDQGFAVVPVTNQRKLWALRMVVLSKTGKNVSIAM